MSFSFVRLAATRLVEALVTVAVIVTLSFFLMRFAPGSPFDRERPLPAGLQSALEARYGLEEPLLTQYWRTASSLVTLDFGVSLTRPGRGEVRELLAPAFARSLELGAWGFLLALAYGLSLSLLTALSPRPGLRAGLRLLSQIGILIPVIALGPLMVNLFAVRLQWLPPGGFEGAAARVLPASCLGLVYGAVFFRLLDGGLEDAGGKPWAHFFRVLGVSRSRIVLRHALPASFSPFVSYLGPALSSLLTGSFVVERVFNIPGLSVAFVDAAQTRDYPVILAIVFVYALTLITLNLLSELLHALIDPRIRYGANRSL